MFFWPFFYSFSCAFEPFFFHSFFCAFFRPFYAFFTSFLRPFNVFCIVFFCFCLECWCMVFFAPVLMPFGAFSSVFFFNVFFLRPFSAFLTPFGAFSILFLRFLSFFWRWFFTAFLTLFIKKKNLTPFGAVSSFFFIFSRVFFYGLFYAFSYAKTQCKLRHFLVGWSHFCNVKKTWKARNAVNSGVLATFGRWNAGIYAVFCPWRWPNPCKLQHFFTLVEPIVCLDERKTCWYLRVFQKIKDRDVNETL